jgi:hypothetical protein
VNQKMYLDRLQAWAAEGRSGSGPKQVIYFEAFDEPWKQGDDGWGLFNARREARHVVQGLGTCGVTWTCEAGSHTTADAVKWVAPTLSPAVTAARYTLFADTAVAGEERATGLRWDPFANSGYAFPTDGTPSADGGAHLAITPNPLNYGWGLFHYSAAGVTANLSNFAGGRLNFMVRSDGYPGKIEVGISTDTPDREVQEAYLQVGPGDYGHCNTGAWCTVSIPLTAFTAVNPKLDLSLVLLRFVIADRYALTGKADGAAITTPILVDAIRWSK